MADTAILSVGRLRLTRHKPLLWAGLMLIVLATTAATINWRPTHFVRSAPIPTGSDAQLDARLQRAAEDALGQREGAILIIDPSTGHLRAVVNPAIAFKSAFAPGSAIKPFTALAALRSHVINPGTRIECRNIYRHEDFSEACSHPRNLAPLNLEEGLAYSCNYYFGRVGEHLKGSDFDQTLREFGFGSTSGLDIDGEASGVLLAHSAKPQRALGEDPGVKTTPVQLLIAYTALLNGGSLFSPSLRGPSRVRSLAHVSNEERSTIVGGLRKAVEIGTAKDSGLSSLPFRIVGKTGTTSQEHGFRSQGWFVGFAYSEDSEPTLGVVIFLAKGHGSQAAELARPIFEHFAKSSTNRRESSQGAIEARDSSQTMVRVHSLSNNVTTELSLEDYVARVVATEGSSENESEALKALAVVVRTFTIKNLERHKEAGYDFCSTTHCQRFDPHLVSIPDRISRAVRATQGLTLNSEGGQVIETFYGASCGGHTANIQTLWGVPAAPYLRGVRDDYCQSGQHYRWTDVVKRSDLARALRSDNRTAVGERIVSLTVDRRDETGRAELIRINGTDRTIVINGWDFKLIVGRALGWNVLKSSRFSVSTSGPTIVFHGGGFGHGLGLCQEGAHVMAEQGHTFRDILLKYFPESNIGNSPEKPRIGDADLIWRQPPDRPLRTPFRRLRRRTISSEGVRINYPENVERTDVDDLMQLVEIYRSKIRTRLSVNGIDTSTGPIELFVNESTGDFVARTGQPAWAAAATNQNHIELQPLKLLKQRRILETTLHHELVHHFIETVGNKQVPRWLSEGLALYVTGEGERLIEASRQAPLTESLAGEIETATTFADMKQAYAAAYLKVKRIIRQRGEPAVWKMVQHGTA